MPLKLKLPVNKWMSEVGYEKCNSCGVWKSIVGEFYPRKGKAKNRRCAECSRKYARGNYEKDPARVRSYQKPELLRAASRRYYLRNRETLMAQSREKYKQRMRDPKYRAHMRKLWREAQWRRKAANGN